MSRLDADLYQVDALGKRWALWGKEREPLHQLEKMRLLHDGAVIGGGPMAIPEDVRLWDECLEHAETPKETKELLRCWYETRLPASKIAGRLRISPATFWKDFTKALWFMKGRLIGSGLKV